MEVVTKPEFNEAIEGIRSEFKKEIGILRQLLKCIAYVTVPQAAIMIGKSERTVYRMLKDPNCKLRKKQECKGIDIELDSVIEYNLEHTR